MIRKIIDFTFNNRIYKIGEITLGDYLLFLDDPNEAVKKMILEFNKEMPKYLDEKGVEILVNGLFSFLEEKDKKTDKSKKDKAKKNVEENGSESMTESIAWFMNIYHQQRSELINMPLKTFIALSDMIPKVQGGETDEEKDTPDKKKILELADKIKLPIDNHL